MVRKKEYPDYLGSSNMAKDRRSLNDFFVCVFNKKNNNTAKLKYT